MATEHMRTCDSGLNNAGALPPACKKQHMCVCRHPAPNDDRLHTDTRKLSWAPEQNAREKLSSLHRKIYLGIQVYLPLPTHLPSCACWLPTNSTCRLAVRGWCRFMRSQVVSAAQSLSRSLSPPSRSLQPAASGSLEPLQAPAAAAGAAAAPPRPRGSGSGAESCEDGAGGGGGVRSLSAPCSGGVLDMFGAKAPPKPLRSAWDVAPFDWDRAKRRSASPRLAPAMPAGRGGALGRGAWEATLQRGRGGRRRRSKRQLRAQGARGGGIILLRRRSLDGGVVGAGGARRRRARCPLTRPRRHQPDSLDEVEARPGSDATAAVAGCSSSASPALQLSVDVATCSSVAHRAPFSDRSTEAASRSVPEEGLQPLLPCKGAGAGGVREEARNGRVRRSAPPRRLKISGGAAIVDGREGWPRRSEAPAGQALKLACCCFCSKRSSS